MNEKKKNFLLLGLVAIITVMLVFIMNFWYGQSNKKQLSLTAKYLYEITDKDFENYVMDNSDAIIYLAKGKDITIRNFEKKFIDLINKEELSKEIVYLNLDNINRQFYKDLKEYYSDELKLESISHKTNIIIIKDRKIVDVLYPENKTIKIEDVEEFFKENGVIE